MTTKSLLGCGILAGPLYVAVSLTQALTRDGFDLRRHAWSLLSNGDLGWLQITNFIGTGLLTVAGAAGLWRTAVHGWAPRLLGIYGVSLIVAGIFRADPAQGFPVGTAQTTTVSWHGLVHFTAGAVGFGCLIAACFVLARRLHGALAWFSGATGAVFAAGFASVATGQSTVAFVAAVILAWAWFTTVCTYFKRS
jgi:hypothetical protein